MHLSNLGVRLSDISRLTNASQPQIFRKDKLGLFPVHISCGVLSTDFDGTLLSVKAAVSRAYPQNDKGKSRRKYDLEAIIKLIFISLFHDKCLLFMLELY